MQAGIIDNLFSYYLENDKFALEIERAKKEFFGAPKDGILLSFNKEYEHYFMEWLLFDFILKNGKSLVADYYDRNPRNKPFYEMQVYRELQANVYGMIEVQKVYPGEALDVLMLHTGKKYHVHEVSGSYQLKQGNLSFVRVAKVNGQYEFVGADTIMLPMQITVQTSKYLFDKKTKLTPKDARGFLVANKEKKLTASSFNIKEFSDIEELKSKFNELLKDLEIDKAVSADLVQKWLREIDFKGAGTPIVDILVGLAKDFPTKEQVQRLIKLVADLSNQSPQKRLKGKSPKDLAKENNYEFGSQGFEIAITRIGGEWSDHANKAMDLLKNSEIEKAQKHYEKAFKTLVKEQATQRYIFSMFANYGVCYLYYGREYIAQKLFEAALEINPEYDFAKERLKALDSKEGTKFQADVIRYFLKYNRTKKWKDFRKKTENYSDKKLRLAYYNISLLDEQRR
jgi:tetratricopeptide (TPR) repeat protein